MAAKRRPKPKATKQPTPGPVYAREEDNPAYDPERAKAMMAELATKPYWRKGWNDGWNLFPKIEPGERPKPTKQQGETS